MQEEKEPTKKEIENIEKAKLILEEWKTVIQTQMHFNEMIIRARTTGMSVVIAVYGAAALAYGRYPDKYFRTFGLELHVSAAIICLGLLLLLGIFFIDYLYYFGLLLGAVDRGEEIDRAYHDRVVDGVSIFGLTSAISKRVSKTRARVCLLVFYGIPFLVGMISIYLVCIRNPPSIGFRI